MTKERTNGRVFDWQSLTTTASNVFEKLTHVETTESERAAAQVHRYMTLKHSMEGFFRSMSNLKVEDYENFAKVDGPAIVIASHKYAIDWLGVGIAAEDFLRLTYIDQLNKGMYWDVASWMGRYGGAIAVNGDRSFLRKVFKAFDRGEKVLLLPEGNENQGNNAVGRSLSQSVKDWPKIYKKRTKVPERQESEIPIIPVGLVYKESPTRKPLPIEVPTPWATDLTVVFGEPIYPSEDSEMMMDDYMRIVAMLSNRPFAPDLVDQQITL